MKVLIHEVRMKKIFCTLVVVVISTLVCSAQPYTIQQYLNIKSASAPTFSSDGKQIAYLTNATGTSQIWVTSIAGGKPKQLTNYDDNVSLVRWLPDGTGIVFGKAKGGDENTQFYWMKPDGTGVRALTNDPTVRHNFGFISPDGKLIGYASNKRNRSYFDIYTMEIATGKETLQYQQDGNNDLAAVMENGSKFVVSRSGTELSLDNNLYLIDAKTKAATLLTPHSGAAQFGNVHFVADGIIYGQDEGREFFSLSQMRKKNAAGDDWSDGNREVKVIDETPWDVSDIEMMSYGGWIAYAINREGFSELFIRRLETGGKPLIATVSGTAEPVKLPAQGIVGGLAFSKDQQKLVFSFSSARNNTDIWVYDRTTKQVTQITKSDRAGIAQESFIMPKLIKYKTFDGREIPAWYYQPKTYTAKVNQQPPTSSAWKQGTPPPPTENIASAGRDVRPPLAGTYDGTGETIKTSAGGMPVIVSVHGGPEGQERPGFTPLTQYYLSRGYAVLAPNVRGSTGYGKTYTHLDDVLKREESVADLAFAVEWLKTNGGADPHRIAVTGGSYGGYMTLAAITLYPDLWAAAVDTVGIVNWETFLKNTSGYRRRQREVEYGMLDKDIDFLRAISPITKVDRISTPLFVIHGKNDPRVPYTEAEQLVEALRKRAAAVEYKLYDDEGHGISKLKNRLDLYPRVADFLDAHMK